MSSADIGQSAPLTASARTCGRCGSYVVVLPGWSVYCSTCKTTTTTTTIIDKSEQEPQTVPITQVPALPNPFAWWSEDHFLALRPCSVEELPGLLEAAAAHVRANTRPKPLPSPLYQNSTRTEPAQGDIARCEGGGVWGYHQDTAWTHSSGWKLATGELVADGPLILLWDGVTDALPAVAS